MVLLDEKKPELTPLRKKIRLVVRIFIGVAVLFGISLYVLSALGGDHEALKKGIEDYLRKSTHMEASIGRFDYMGFFPEVKVDLGDIQLTKAGEDKASMKVGSLKFAMDFWDLFFARHRVNQLLVEDFYSAPGIRTEKELRLDKVEVAELPDSDKGGLSVKGAYGGAAFSAHMGMEISRDGDKIRFTRPDQSAFSFTSQALTAEGTIGSAGGGRLALDFTSIGMPDKVAAGKATVRDSRGREIEIDLTSGGSRITGTLRQKGDHTGGDISFPVLDIDDIAPLYALYESIDDFIYGDESGDPLDFGSDSINVRVTVDSLISDDSKLGRVGFNVRLENNLLTIGPFEGAVSGGKLSGNVTLDASKSPALLKAEAGIAALDYGALSRGLFGKAEFMGNADIKVSLGSEAKTTAALARNLKGEIVGIAGEGTFASGLLNVWGGGLLNAMLPSLDPASEMRLNCMIADFKVENGIATASPLFIDTNRVTIAGDGVIDLAGNKVDIRLTPKAKDIVSIGTITAVPVRLSGPMGNVSAGADTMGLGTALGKLFLGTINPAFMVFSMTDLGLTENHPCRKYIETPDE